MRTRFLDLSCCVQDLEQREKEDVLSGAVIGAAGALTSDDPADVKSKREDVDSVCTCLFLGFLGFFSRISLHSIEDVRCHKGFYLISVGAPCSYFKF